MATENFLFSSVTEKPIHEGRAITVAREPIAIVGIGCRFPGGASSPAIFWRHLLEGKDCIVDVPSDRWDWSRFYAKDRQVPGKMHVNSGGFLQENIDEFDALFFGISPREASVLDPQQRVLLEVSWEALENAGIDPHSLAGTQTGVFIGGFMLDNKLTQLSPLNRHTIGSDTAVGMTSTMLSNRLSYFYDLKGPSLSIDTACSSSLVALDQACSSIWQGNSQLALVGGVNMMHRPEIFIAMSKGGFLAPDGRSKAFDARADGYGRGEGAGIVVIKPLAQAEQDGDAIIAIIRATGSNQDGRTEGITVPNGESQKTLIKKVCHQAGVKLSDIDYFEAHGTGTPVGDPIEMAAIGGTIGQAKPPGKPCIVGSVKGNIGHLEAASGVAALIKSALCLQHKQVPPQANLQTLNPAIPFDALNIKIPFSVQPIHSDRQAIFAGINSFGYGGTNACAILEGYTPKKNNHAVPIRNIEGLTYLLPFSAKSKPALKNVANNYLKFLNDNPSADIADVCYSAGAKKAHLNHRAIISASTMDEMKEKLSAVGAEDAATVITQGHVQEKRNQLVFVFTGMGPQWWKMGRELMQTEPVFYRSVQTTDRILQRLSGWSILEELLAPEELSRITDTQFAQTANFAIQIALVELWQSWGIEPAAVVGHSVGEVSSAYVSGMLTLEQAILVSYERSRIQKKAAHQGGMLAVGISEEQAAAMIKPHQDKVSIAAINAPTAITLAGDDQVLEEIAKTLESQGLFNRKLQVEVAYHSPTMSPLLDEIHQCLAVLSPRPASLPCYSTVTGEMAQDDAFNAEYWCHNVRKPVYFFKAIENMVQAGYRDFIEIGPHPVLSASIKEAFATHPIEGFLTASLHRKFGEQATIKQAAAELYCRGYAFNWKNLCSDKVLEQDGDCERVTPTFLRLPNYPWQKEQYWNDAAVAKKDRTGDVIPRIALGAKQEGPGQSWVSLINPQVFPHLQDHKVEGLVILAGATYVEAALSIYHSLFQDDACLVKEVRLHQAMVIDQHAEPIMHTHYNEIDHRFLIYSYEIADKNHYTLHASGVVEKLVVKNNHRLPLENIKAQCTEQLAKSAVYADLHARGLSYGPGFQGIETLWRKDHEVFATIRISAEIVEQLNRYQLHPAILDACFQSLMAAIPHRENAAPQVYVPSFIEQIRHYHRVTHGDVVCHGVLTLFSTEQIIGHLTIADSAGTILVEIIGLRCQALRNESHGTTDNIDDWSYQLHWQQAENRVPHELSPPAITHVVLVNDDETGAILKSIVAEQSMHPVCSVYQYPDASARACNEAQDISFCVDPSDPNYLSDIVSRIYSTTLCLHYAWGVVRDEHDPIHLRHTQQLANLLKQANQLADHYSIRVCIYTVDAAKVNDDDRVTGFYQSPLIGLARSAATEMPALHTMAIECDGNDLARSFLQAVYEIHSDTKEQELAYRGAVRYVRRLQKIALADLYQGRQVALHAGQAMVWAQQGVSTAKQLSMQQCTRRAPQENEIELLIHSVLCDDSIRALNARREITARVVRIGPAATRYQVGQELLAIYDGVLTNYLTLAEDKLLAVNIPKRYASNTMPSLSAYLYAQTMLYRMNRIGDVGALLVLGSDTLVGQVCVNLAQCLGVPHTKVMLAVSPVAANEQAFSAESSTLQADLIHHLLHQHGLQTFDLIINVGMNTSCLIPDQLLSEFGKWIDVDPCARGARIGNQPALSASKLYSHLQRDSVIPQTLDKQSPLFRNNLAHVETLLQLSAKQPLYARPIAISAVGDDLPAGLPGVMMLGDNTAIRVTRKSDASVHFQSNLSYLITGGFGGFGLSLARWLVKQGVRHLVLVSRSGANNPASQHALAELRSHGVQVYVGAVDIANASEVAALLSDIQESMPPLAGIFHTAGVIDDKPMMEADAACYATVMQAKAMGAWVLHQLTLHLDLDCFVLYSSMSALIGNRNQSNYVAANLWLDGLANHRHSLGLAATSINWGVLSGIGMAAANPAVIHHLENMGIAAFSADQALEWLANLCQAPVAQLGLFKVDWQRWKQYESASEGSRFYDVITSHVEDDARLSWLERLHKQADETTVAMLETLSELLAGILKLKIDQLDVDVPIINYGVASLMAMDLQMQIRAEFKIDVSILQLMKGNSLRQLVGIVIEKMLGSESITRSDERDAQPERATFESIDLEAFIHPAHTTLDINAIDSLSEGELDHLLRLNQEMYS